MNMLSILRAIAGKALRGEMVSEDERNLFNVYVHDHALTPTIIQCGDHPMQAVLLMQPHENPSPFVPTTSGLLCPFCRTGSNVTIRSIERLQATSATFA
jgi:hypothetical protein